MSLYDRIKAASDSRDSDTYLDMLHDDYVFYRHQTNSETNKADWEPTMRAMMASAALKITDDRCLYENDEVLVMHQIMRFPDDTSEAVMIVHMLKDGKIIRTETGATPIT